MANEMVRGNRGGNETIECPDCGRWCYADDKKGIRHSKRCDIYEAIEAKRAEAAKADYRRRQLVRAAKDGSLRSVASDDEIQKAVTAGWISQSDAMNQDM